MSTTLEPFAVPSYGTVPTTPAPGSPNPRSPASVPSVSLLDAMRERSDRALAVLLAAHWPVALLLASLRGTWLAALLIGGVASLVPVIAAWVRPGAVVTRMLVTVCLMVYSMLFIAQTGGMIEMHFHVFAGMAFLLIYRDWRLPILAGLVVALHHGLFNWLQMQGHPDLVFADHHGWHIVGVHAVFVAFEGAVLVYMARLLENEVAQSQALVAAARRLGTGDLTGRISVVAGPMGAAAQALNDATDALGSIVRDLTARAGETDTMSGTLTGAVARQRTAAAGVEGVIARIADGATRQKTETAAMTIAFDDMVRRVHGVATGIAGMAEASSRAAEAAATSASLMARALAAINRMEIAVRDATEQGRDLYALSSRVDAMLQAITDIAARTNMLALNASIEAARAGDKGRGFAVVAEEVRQLADGASRAVREASETAIRIRGGIEQVVARMEHGLGESADSLALAGSLETALQELKRSSAAGISDVQAVARLSEEIATETQRILGDSSDGVARRTVRALTEVSAANVKAAAEAADAARDIEDAMVGIGAAARDLDSISLGLRSAAGRFQL